MKINKLVILGLLLTGCSPIVNIPTPSPSSTQAQSSVKPLVSSSPSSASKPSVNPDGTINTKQSGEPSTAISPNPKPDENVNPGNVSTNPVTSATPIPSSSPSCIGKQQGISPGFNDVNPIPKGILSGRVSVVFKDEYKIRIDKNNPKYFISLNGTDLTELNKIVDDYSARIISIYSNLTEEELAAQEKKMEDWTCSDYPNNGSFSSFYVNNINMEEIILRVRALNYVLSSNYSYPGSTGEV